MPGLFSILKVVSGVVEYGSGQVSLPPPPTLAGHFYQYINSAATWGKTQIAQ